MSGIIKQLEDFYLFDNPQKVKDFILSNDYLVNILFEAPAQIYKFFGNVQLILELHKDYEEKWEKLFIVIKSPYEIEESFEREKQLISLWFLGKIDETKGQLSIVEEPI